MSATLRAFELVKTLRSQGVDVYDGGLGQNPIPPPQKFRDAVGALCKKHYGYTTCKGTASLRTSLKCDRLITGNGLKPILHMLQLAFHRHTRKSGVIFHCVPHWPTYAEQADLIGAKVRVVQPSNKKGYKITAGDLDRALFTTCVLTTAQEIADTKSSNHLAQPDPKLIDSPQSWISVRPAMVLLNSPNNPSGAVYTSRELCEIRRTLAKYRAICVFDGIYSELTHLDYDPVETPDVEVEKRMRLRMTRTKKKASKEMKKVSAGGEMTEEGTEEGTEEETEEETKETGGGGGGGGGGKVGGSTYALDDALTSLDHCNYDRCIFVTSVSKMLGAGGWRAGLAAFGDDLEDFYGYAAKVASCMYTCPTAGMTYLMEEVFAPHSVLQHVLEKHLLFQRSIFTRIHSRVCAVFEGSGIEVSEAHGAWYVLLDFSKFKAALHAVGVRTSAALTARLVEEKRVVLVPGSEFGFDREALCARFSYVDLTMDESQSVDFSRIVQLCEKLVEFVDATVEAVEVRSTQAAADADCYFD